MKKVILIALLAIMSVLLVSCNNSNNNDKNRIKISDDTMIIQQSKFSRKHKKSYRLLIMK